MVIKKRAMVTFLISLSVLSLSACSQKENTVQTQETTITSKIAQSSSIDSTQEQTAAIESSSGTTVQNFAFTSVPEEYYSKADRQGRLETITYTVTSEYTDKKKNEAIVYIPYGYDETDVNTRYNIFYLMHGGGGSQRTYMGTQSSPTALKNMIDNMIEDEKIPPTIFVMATIDTGSITECQENANYFYEELGNDLMPSVEGKYHTYAETTTQEGFEASREHRGFGGFSMGGVTTWSVLANRLDYFANFLPMSGDSWLVETMGGSSATDETAKLLNDAVTKFGYKTSDYRIFAATGTNDSAYTNLPPQMEAMKKYPNTFLYTDQSFAEGNMTLYIVKGNYHDYSYTYEYIYNGLQYLF